MQSGMSPTETGKQKFMTSMVDSANMIREDDTPKIREDDTPLLYAEDDSDIMTFGQPFSQSRASASGSELTLENVQIGNIQRPLNTRDSKVSS